MVRISTSVIHLSTLPRSTLSPTLTMNLLFSIFPAQYIFFSPRKPRLSSPWLNLQKQWEAQYFSLALVFRWRKKGNSLNASTTLLFVNIFLESCKLEWEICSHLNLAWARGKEATVDRLWNLIPSWSTANSTFHHDILQLLSPFVRRCRRRPCYVHGTKWSTKF